MLRFRIKSQLLIKESKERDRRLVYQYNNKVGSTNGQSSNGGMGSGSAAASFFGNDDCRSCEAEKSALRVSLDQCLKSAKLEKSSSISKNVKLSPPISSPTKRPAAVSHVAAPVVQEHYKYVETQINS